MKESEKRHIRMVGVFFLCILAGVNFLMGCKAREKTPEGKVRDLTFTLTEETALPEELKELIKEKKAMPMQFSYSIGNEMYIVIGYGTKETGGYSITADALYLTEDSIVVRTTLLGPKKEQKAEQTESYPYIVLKTEYVDMTIQYQ